MKNLPHSPNADPDPVSTENPFAAHTAAMPDPDEAERWLAFAERYLACGLAPLLVCGPTRDGGCSCPWHPNPCVSGRRSSAGKKPAVPRYPAFADSPPSISQIRRWAYAFYSPNLAVVIPKGLVCVECDSAKAEEELVGLDPRLCTQGPCRERRPGRGRAWLFRTSPTARFRSSSGLGKSGAVDVIAPGKPLIVAPSIHCSGHVVHWVQGRAPWEATPLPLHPRVERLLVGAAKSGAPMSRRPSTQAGATRPGTLGAVPARIQLLIRTNRQVRDAWNRRGKRFGDDSASGYDATLACLLLNRRVPAATVVKALLACPGASKHEVGYAERTVHEAQQFLREGKASRWG